MSTRGREFMKYTTGPARRWFKRWLSRQRRREDRGIVIEALLEMEEEEKRIEMEEARLEELYEAEMLRIERLDELLELERIRACELVNLILVEEEMREAEMHDALMDDLFYLLYEEAM